MCTSPPTTQKPLDFCFPKDATPLPAGMPLPYFINIIECESTEYCEPDNKSHLGFPGTLGYL